MGENVRSARYSLSEIWSRILVGHPGEPRIEFRAGAGVDGDKHPSLRKT